jgi:AcrR family transcriptional regulator
VKDSSGIGLRERKRAQTAEAIHVAAAELVLERGLDAATIDAISDRADVSTRTFFNYYPSKEDAVLGIDERAILAELDRVRDSDGDPLSLTFDLIYALFQASGGGREKPHLTREVMVKYPQLMSRHMVRIADLEDRLSDVVAGWLGRDPRFAADTDDERMEEARIIVGLCLATVRMTMKKWAAERDAASAGATATTTDPRKTYERAIATLRTVLEKLT